MISGIYAILNIINGKMYVGSGINLKNRWKNHLIELRLNRHHSTYLQSAWNKYSINNFIFTVLEYVEDETKLIIKEQYWIDFYKSYDREFGYNVCQFAGNNLGRKASPETLGKLSLLRLGRPRLEDTKRKISETMKGRQFSVKTLEKMSEAQKGKKKSDKFKKNMSERLKGNKFASVPKTEEQKKAHSAAMKKVWAERKKSLDYTCDMWV